MAIIYHEHRDTLVIDLKNFDFSGQLFSDFCGFLKSESSALINCIECELKKIVEGNEVFSSRYLASNVIGWFWVVRNLLQASLQETFIQALFVKDKNNQSGWAMLARYAPQCFNTALEFVCTEEQRERVVFALCEKDQEGSTGWAMMMRSSAADLEKIYQWPCVGGYIKLLLYANAMTHSNFSKIQESELLRDALDVISSYVYSPGTGVLSALRHAGGKLESKQCIAELMSLDLTREDIHIRISGILSQWARNSRNHNSSRSSFLRSSDIPKNISEGDTDEATCDLSNYGGPGR
ncbi:hypothetical protein [Candidiatus Paracoxiella cheracis]|uniref:hypothetical protein n=1 Tax=Candidiatus Paracoxiella cheracis TaxID=3405120 RepID=UPI003BF5A423